MCVCVCVFGQHFFVDTYLIKQYWYFCQHIFVFILSNCRINFMISSGNWLINLPQLIGSLILSVRHYITNYIVYYKSNVNFACTLLLKIFQYICTGFKINSIYFRMFVSNVECFENLKFLFVILLLLYCVFHKNFSKFSGTEGMLGY